MIVKEKGGGVGAGGGGGAGRIGVLIFTAFTSWTQEQKTRT